MTYHQHKLFDYTRTSELLTGEEVIRADHLKRDIKVLQKQGKLTENWRLDISCRDPGIITDIFVEKIDPTCGAIHYGTHAIWIMVDPVCIKKYAIPISFLRSKEEAIALLETVRAYLCYRYGI